MNEHEQLIYSCEDYLPFSLYFLSNLPVFQFSLFLYIFVASFNLMFSRVSLSTIAQCTQSVCFVL